MSIEQRILHWHKLRNETAIVRVQHFQEEGIHLSSENTGISIGGNVPTQLYQDNNSIVLGNTILLNSKDEIIFTSKNIVLNSEEIVLNNKSINKQIINNKSILSATSNLKKAIASDTKFIIGEPDLSKGQVSLQLKDLIDINSFLGNDRIRPKDEIMNHLKKVLSDEANN